MRALALFSGGLDSTLAMKLIIDQGIDVTAINIKTGFGSSRDKLEHMKNMCRQVGAELLVVDVQNQYLQEVLFSPKYGYGKNFNPCIDCHGFMFSVAKKMMKELDASFLISGEVVGQRPMSQNRDALQTVEEIGDVEGLLLRPLCAKNLPETTPEIEGWVNREKLMDIYGRSRHVQMELVHKYDLKDYESPGGGCLLTDENFSRKLRDFIKHDESFEVDDVAVLKYGRHFRLPDGAKLVVGREHEENGHLEVIENRKFTHAQTVDNPGPHSLISFDATKNDRLLAAQMIAVYSKKIEGEHEILFDNISISVMPLESREAAQAYSI